MTENQMSIGLEKFQGEHQFLCKVKKPRLDRGGIYTTYAPRYQRVQRLYMTYLQLSCKTNQFEPSRFGKRDAWRM